MSPAKKNFIFSAVIFVLFFALLELPLRVFSPPATYDFIERRIFEQNLRLRKSPGEIRIFMFGESTMLGGNLYPKSTIKKWMDLYAEKILGEKAASRVNVLNLGRLGEGSGFFLEAFSQTLGYRPDIVVFYSAHNDFAIRQQRDELLFGKSPGDRIHGFFSGLVRKSALLSSINRLFIRKKALRKQRASKADQYSEGYEFIEIEKKPAGLYNDQVAMGSEAFQKVQKNWEDNIVSIIRVGQKYKIPVIFFEGVADFKDYPPRASAHKKDITAEQLRSWERLNSQAEALLASARYDEASRLLEECLQYDNEYAMSYYRLGQCYERLGDYARANTDYKLANDFDLLRSRGPSTINKFYERLSSGALPGVFVIPTPRIFEESSEHGIMDGRLLADTVHPTIQGQALMALSVLRLLYQQNLLPADMIWHWENLPVSYLVLQDKLGIDDEFLFFYYLNRAKFMLSYSDKALEYANKALEIDPGSLAAQRLVAWIHWQRGDIQEAVREYRELYKKAPKTIEEVFAKFPKIKQALGHN